MTALRVVSYDRPADAHQRAVSGRRRPPVQDEQDPDGAS